MTAPSTAAAPVARVGATGRLTWWWLLALAVVAALAVLSLAVGARTVPLQVTWDAVLHHDSSITDHLVVREARVPRTLAGLLVGVALGIAGALMQGLTRNPLADPGLLGVNAGASLAVVTAIGAFGITSPLGYVWFAIGGAAAAAAVVYSVAAVGRDGATPVKLALSGAAVTAACLSMVSGVLLSQRQTFESFRFWQVGALAGRDLELVTLLAPFVLVGAVLGITQGRVLNALGLGDDVARALGMHVGRARAVGALAVVVLAGTATALAGPIVFVGLVVPHVARRFTGPDYRWIVPFSAVLAAMLLLAADIVGRLLTHPGEVQVGIVTAVIGAPVFIALVRRTSVGSL